MTENRAAAPADWKNRWLIAAMPIGMLLLWLAVIAQGDGRLDALGNPIGGDFAMFYIAGNMAWQGQWHLLYDEAAQQRRLIELFPGLPIDTYLPYRYPPLLAAILAPLGSLPYRTAQAIWCSGSILVWLLSWWALQQTFFKRGSYRALNPQLVNPQLTMSQSAMPQSMPTQRSSMLVGTCLVGLIASPVFAQTIIDGQASCWWFGILAATWIAFHRERFALAGACLALAACKPNVLLLVGVVLVVKQPRMLLGIATVGCIMLLATLATAGRDCLAAYIQLGSQLATQSWSVETPYWKVQSLLSWTELLLGSASRSTNLMLGLIAAVGIGAWWRRHDQRTSSALSMALLTGALFNPYTPVYDLLLLSLGMFAWLVHAARAGLLEQALDQREIKLLIACLWAGPIVSQCLSRELACPQQWMPIVLLILLIRIVERQSSAVWAASPPCANHTSAVV